MTLQNFVIQVIEIIGGDIELVEYALCYVILPEDYIDIFEGITEKRKEELESKSKALKFEREKQKKEMKDKHSIDIQLSLDYGVMYFIPTKRYKIKTQISNKENISIVYYNYITKEFFKNKIVKTKGRLSVPDYFLL